MKMSSSIYLFVYFWEIFRFVKSIRYLYNSIHALLPADELFEGVWAFFGVGT